MAEPVRVTIYDSRVDSLFLPGGDVWGWMGGVGAEHLQAAYMFAPRRSGHLASQHYPVAIITPYKKRGVRYTIRNDADYALFVHEGTTGPIVADYWDDGTQSFLGPMAPWGGFSTPFARSVSGQRANPWINKAGEFVLAQYGITGISSE